MISVRALKVLVVAMGVLIVAGTLALVGVIVQRMGRASEGMLPVGVVLAQPEGARIAGIAAVDRWLGVWVARADGDRVLLVDPRGGRVAGEIRLRE